MNLFRKLSAFKATIRTYSKEILDPEKLFLHPKINNLLQNLIDHNPTKVHKLSIRKRAHPVIQLLSNEQHKDLERKTSGLTKQKLQMPPVKNPRKDDVEILEQNEKLNRFVPKGNKIVYVDIGMSDKNRDRLMAIRESDGTLRSASCEERDRYNLVYFPLPGREFIPPPMFNEDNLLNIMAEGRYAYILDRNCIQFEPDDPAYITICFKVYEHVNNTFEQLKGFRSLAPTRHFGGLVLYLVIRNIIGNLLIDLLSIENWDSIGNLFALYCLVHPTSPFALNIESDKTIIDTVERFMNKSSVTPVQANKIKFLINCHRESEILNKQSL